MWKAEATCGAYRQNKNSTVLIKPVRRAQPSNEDGKSASKPQDVWVGVHACVGELDYTLLEHNLVMSPYKNTYFAI